jgi:hypothetical protein
MEPLFPEVDLEAITGMSEEDISSLIDRYNAAFGAIASGAAFEGMEDPPDLNERKRLAQEGAETLKALKTALSEKSEERERFAAEMAEIAADAGVTLESEGEDDGEGDSGDGEGEGEGDGEPAVLEAAAEGEGDGGEGDGEGDGEVSGEESPEGASELAVTASASAPAPFRHRPPPVPRKHQPIEVEEGVALVASVGIEGITPGEKLDRDGLSYAVTKALQSFVSTPPGFEQKVVVASARWDYPEERKLYGDSIQADDAKIRAIRSPEALVASGGWCAPSTIRYEIDAMGVTERPVRDAFAGFNATRGGLRYYPDISIAATDVTDGITHLTEAQDEGGTFTKDCVVVECPIDSEVRADIIAACLQAGNLASIAFPELIAAYQDLLGVQAARTRDSLLLDAVFADAQTKTVTETAQAYSAFDGLIYNLLRLAAGYRSRHRLSADAVLRALAPAWLADLIVADLTARQFPLPDIARAAVAAEIQRRTQVSVDFYLDSRTGGGQIMGAQGDGSDILDFPDIPEVLLWPEGGILFIDQGELNIGLVRDSLLNETNDVKFFSETFENAAVIAAEAFYGRFTLCPTGTTAGTATARTC